MLVAHCAYHIDMTVLRPKTKCYNEMVFQFCAEQLALPYLIKCIKITSFLALI